ncbi:MAG: hypothetical protein ACREQY_19280, partial [Candidatus Binatia bacterium]
MTRIGTIGLIGALVIAGAGVASAHGTACCSAFACPVGQTAVPGETPEAAQCCTDPADPSTCTAVPNAGWACQSDAEANAQATPERGAIAGCVDGEYGVCVGGAVSPGGEPAGC